VNTKPLGNFGENVAADYLRQKRYTIMERQYRCKIGEIDIIARDNTGTVVFVEVKTRRNDNYGQPALAVTKHKQGKIIRAAMWYAHLKRFTQINFRFDVIEVYIYPNGEYRVQHYINAFEV
jgi:putative endonuclease